MSTEFSVLNVLFQCFIGIYIFSDVRLTHIIKITYLLTYLVSGEAILSAENSGKPLDARGSTPKPAGRAHSASSDSLADGEGVAAAPQEPHPLSRPSVLAPE